MRNPIRLKSLRLRFLPVFAIVAVGVMAYEPKLLASLLGLCLVASGTTLRTWGAGHLVKRDRLTVTGPYAYLRHPLYAGTLLIILGFAVALDGWLMWALLLTNAIWFFLSYFPRKERIESTRLESLYGGAFARYRSQVPALVPSPIAWRPSREIAQGVALSEGWSSARYSENNEFGTLLAVVAGAGLLALRAATGA